MIEMDTISIKNSTQELVEIAPNVTLEELFVYFPEKEIRKAIVRQGKPLVLSERYDDLAQLLFSPLVYQRFQLLAKAKTKEEKEKLLNDEEFNQALLALSIYVCLEALARANGNVFDVITLYTQNEEQL